MMQGCCRRRSDVKKDPRISSQIKSSYFGAVRTDVERTPDRALVGVECTALEVPSGRVDEGVGKPAWAHVAPCFASTLHAWACAPQALAIGRLQCSGAPVALVGRA